MNLRVSPDGQFLQRDDGRPFFYLADTAWELFHRLTTDEARDYLETRAAQGFTVIQAVMLAEFDGLRTPNALGRLPFDNLDPLRPDEAPDGYWAHVDEVIRIANALGLVVGALPTWGDKWNCLWGDGPEVFTPDNALGYGRWLGRRYRDASLVWILGGDRPVETDRHRAVIEAMAAGLREGDGGSHLITFHPSGGSGPPKCSMTRHGSTSTSAKMATRRTGRATPRRTPTTGAPPRSPSSTANRSTRATPFRSTPRNTA